MPPDHASLQAQVVWLLQRLGKAKARGFLRDQIDLALLPAPDQLGV